MDENAEDDLFREFEDSFFHMNSPMGRNDFTEEEKALIRKFKLMKNMIVYLQRIPLFGKFCFYGCYCFAKGPKQLLIDVGNGKPMDGADNACRHHLQCHSCTLLDVAVPLELLRADAVGDADRVPEARRRLGAERVLVLVVRRRRELRRGPRRRGALERRGDRQAERERRMSVEARKTTTLMGYPRESLIHVSSHT